MLKINTNVSVLYCVNCFITGVSTMAAGTTTYPLQYTLALGIEGVDWRLDDFLAEPVVLLYHQPGCVEVIR